MKKIATVVLVVLLTACTDRSQTELNYEKVPSPVSSSLAGVVASNVEMASAVAGTSDVFPTQTMSGVSAAATTNTDNGAPSEEAIIKWAKLDHDAKLQHLLPVQLIDGEKAYVAQIDRFQNANDMYGAYLVRPYSMT